MYVCIYAFILGDLFSSFSHSGRTTRLIIELCSWPNPDPNSSAAISPAEPAEQIIMHKATTNAAFDTIVILTTLLGRLKIEDCIARY